MSYSRYLELAQSRMGRARGRIESSVGQAKTAVEVAAGAYAAGRLSAHLGGPGGKSVSGVPLEVLIGVGCAAVAMSGAAGKHSEDVLAVGLGAVAGYAARNGFEAGVKTARPPAQVSGPIYVPQIPGNISGPIEQAESSIERAVGYRGRN